MPAAATSRSRSGLVSPVTSRRAVPAPMPLGWRSSAAITSRPLSPPCSSRSLTTTSGGVSQWSASASASARVCAASTVAPQLDSTTLRPSRIVRSSSMTRMRRSARLSPLLSSSALAAAGAGATGAGSAAGAARTCTRTQVPLFRRELSSTRVFSNSASRCTVASPRPMPRAPPGALLRLAASTW
ncbi:hypothetical protein FQZ97_1064770 [compost metagenome]